MLREVVGSGNDGVQTQSRSDRLAARNRFAWQIALPPHFQYGPGDGRRRRYQGEWRDFVVLLMLVVLLLVIIPGFIYFIGWAVQRYSKRG